MNVMASLDAGSLGEHWAELLTGYCMSEEL
jgi:hypothetical protein